MCEKPTYDELEKRLAELENRHIERGGETENSREDLEKYRKIVELAPTGIYEVDIVKQRFIRINEIICEATGYDREELLSMNPMDLLTEDSKKHMLERSHRIFAGERVSGKIELKIKAKNGRCIWVLVNTKFIFENGKPVRAIVVASNISDLKQLEDSLRESEGLFRSLVNNILDTVLIIDWDGTVLFTNDAGARLVGFDSAVECIGQNITRFVHPDSLDKTLKDLELVKQGQGGFLADYQLVTLNGKLKWIEARGTKIKFSGSDADLIILRDISDRKQQEEERRQLQLRLQRAQRIESIGNLAGGIAHDFNNLLMTIQGNTSLMLHAMDPDHPFYGMLKNIESAVLSGSKLTNQLLGYARKGRYQTEPLCLNEIVIETAETFGRTRKEIRIEKALASDLLNISADRGQIEQVLLNLYINSAGAMPRGGYLALKTSNVSHEDIKSNFYVPSHGNYVNLTVADTGTGMDKKTLEHIFEPFFTTKEIGKGTGLGLASVYGIIKGHNGYIDVQSQKGQGTVFNIYFPTTDVKKEKTEDPDGLTIVDAALTVLVVDDEEMVLDAGTQLLKKLGHNAFGAGSGLEALEIYKKNKDQIDIVILDMIMPEMNGGEVYDNIKKINPDVKVLLSSGYSIDGQATEILKRGCNGFIQKPYSMKTLSHKIGETIKG